MTDSLEEGVVSDDELTVVDEGLVTEVVLGVSLEGLAVDVDTRLVDAPFSLEPTEDADEGVETPQAAKRTERLNNKDVFFMVYTS